MACWSETLEDRLSRPSEISAGYKSKEECDASEPAMEVLPSSVHAETPPPVVDRVLSSSSSDTAGASTSMCGASTSADSMPAVDAVRQVRSSAWTDIGSLVVVQAPSRAWEGVSMFALQMEYASEPAMEVLPSSVRAETPSPVVDRVLSSSSDTAGASTSADSMPAVDAVRQVQSSAWTDVGSPVVVQAPSTTPPDTTLAEGQWA